MRRWTILAGGLALAACDASRPPEAQPEPEPKRIAPVEANSVGLAPKRPQLPLEPDPAGTRWETAATGEGASLILETPSGERRLTLFCRPRSGELLVNVPRFEAIGSAERMRFGTADTLVALVADAGGDRRRGGISATGPLNADVMTLLRRGEPFELSYGAQSSGPHAPMLPELVQGFIAACRPAARAEG